MSLLKFYGDVHWEGKCIPELGEMKPHAPYIFNLEYAVETKGASPAINKIIVTGRGDFENWKRKPIAVNLANNHIMDLGDAGFVHTVSVLKKNDIAFFGAGCEQDNYNNPCILEIDGRKIGLLGYSDYQNLLDCIPTMHRCAKPTKEQIYQDIKLCKKNLADVIIVNIHWGREERSWNSKRQEMLGHRLIDAGADVVIGHHPHCIQPIECYKGKYIFYSLGNTYFPNLNTPSYYDVDGVSEFNACVRNLKCGKESLKISYNFKKKDIEKIERLKYRKGDLITLGRIDGLSVVPNFYRSGFWNEFTAYLRRSRILVRSNFFVNGKIVNGKAFKKEIEYIRARMQKKE